MSPLEPLVEPTSILSAGSVSDRSGRTRAEHLHRHLSARLAAAQEELGQLDERGDAPEVLVARFGATVSDAQQTLAREWAEEDQRSSALRRAAEAHARQLIADAESEARVLRAVATWLRQVPLGNARPPGGTGRFLGRDSDLVSGVIVAPVVALSSPVADLRGAALYQEIARMQAELEDLERRILRRGLCEPDDVAGPFEARAGSLVERVVSSLLEAGRGDIRAAARQNDLHAEVVVYEARRRAEATLAAARVDLAGVLDDAGQLSRRPEGARSRGVVPPRSRPDWHRCLGDRRCGTGTGG